jgi:hypothetical protein
MILPHKEMSLKVEKFGWGKQGKKKKTTAKKLENKLSPTPNTNAKLFSLIILLAVKHFNAIMLVIIRRHDTTQSLLIRYLRY